MPSAALRFTPTSLSATEIKKDLFLAGLGKLSPADLQAASSRYDQDQKTLASGKQATGSAQSGLSSLMGGGRIPGVGGFGGPPFGAGHQAGQPKSTTAVSGAAAAGAAAATPAKKPLWYLDASGKLALSLVTPGLSDGLSTELVGADELEGSKVILKIKAE